MTSNFFLHRIFLCIFADEMQLQELHIDNFKNIAEAHIAFSDKTNCFLGDNGMGKSNLLDAIYYLSFCKSFSGQTDSLLVRRGTDFMMLKANYLRNGAVDDLQFGFQPGRKKSFRRGGKEYRRLSEHIGLFPLVMAAPSDTELITGHSELRRKFVDRVISQTDSRYLNLLIRYNGLLESRNRILRDSVSSPAAFNADLLSAIDIPMEQAADYIAGKRRSWTEEFTGIFQKYYRAIAGAGAETVSLSYRTTLAPDNIPFAEQLSVNLRRDTLLGHTTAGVHRDDFEMEIDSMPLRRAASQGQCKTFVVAMRLAQYEFLAKAVGFKPLLLLDDIFDKLDAGRVERIIETVSGDSFGQIFITDTNRDHLDTIMHSRSAGSESEAPYRLWRVENGCFSILP